MRRVQRAMFRSTFSTTTMASSTTMPMASTSPKSERALIENPSSSITAKRADERYRHRCERNDRGAPGLQEYDDDQDHQPERLDATWPTTASIDVTARRRRVIRDVVRKAVREGARGSAIALRTLAENSSALVPGAWKTGMAKPPGPSSRLRSAYWSRDQARRAPRRRDGRWRRRRWS